MESANRLELEREWRDATSRADHWVDVIQGLSISGSQSRLDKAKSEFQKAMQEVRDLNKKLAEA